MPEIIREISIWAWAVINNWAGYATGGVIVALAWLWSTFRQKPTSKKFGIGIALVFLCAALFNAWRDQYQKTYPGLRLTIDEWAIGQMDFVNSGNLALLGTGAFSEVTATVRNLGNPSIADNWSFSMSVPDQQNSINGKLVDYNPPPKDPIVISGDPISVDKFLFKLTKSVIPTGDKRQGLLLFFIPDKSRGELEKAHAVMTLTCHDIAGNVITASQEWKPSQSGGHVHFPDLDQ
jgi:hypothetical protein